MSKWTRFMDMHSGGDLKIYPYQYIFIPTPEEEARKIFEYKFGRDPTWVTCECCGEDFSVNEYDDLEQATAYDRNCQFVHLNSEGKECSWEEWCLLPASQRSSRWIEKASSRKMYIPLDEYLKRKDVLVVKSEEIN